MSTLPMNFILIDTNKAIFQGWIHHYKELSVIISKYGLTNHYPFQLSFENITIESLISNPNYPHINRSQHSAAVTPTNSLSYMGGGYDKYLLQALSLPTPTNNSSLDYKPLESVIQHHTLKKFSGYLSVGTIHNIPLLETLDSSWYKTTYAYRYWNITNLIQIPSMMIPESLNHQNQHLQKLIGVFDSVWNLLISLHSNNSDYRDIKNIIIPGIGSGYGELSEFEISKIMIFAMVLFNLNLGTGERLLHLKKSCMILFFFNKNYQTLANIYDLNELETDVITEYGKSVMLNRVKESESLSHANIKEKSLTMEFDDLFKCINLK
ncbi:hypothetical protein DFJ63DRAFT_313284 [Scheffersomyces coipomensis]|uniref:uncharacterized protein n=1 Tax=Scheffersomyces coipomensis TaxID=1788519 RepID=UPI00315CE398